jgi:hypothetical protein
MRDRPGRVTPLAPWTSVMTPWERAVGRRERRMEVVYFILAW